MHPKTAVPIQPRFSFAIPLCALFLCGACHSPIDNPNEEEGGGGASTTAHTTSSHKAASHAATGGEGGDGSGGSEPQEPTAVVDPISGDLYQGAQFYLGGAQSSSPSGNILTYEWTQLSGAHVDIVDPTSPDELVTAPHALGMISFQLIVHDGPYASLPAKLDAVVVDRAPVAHAGHDKGQLGGTNITLDGSGHDDDVDALTYTWTQVSGSPIALSAADTAQPSLTIPDDLSGPAVFALTVNDGYENSVPDWVTVERLTGPDSDGDLLEDSVELALGTDPANPDTDGDGIPDGWEVLGHENVDYAALGCDPLHRDLLVELHVQSYTVANVLHSAEPSPTVQSALEHFYGSLPIDNPTA